MKIISFKWDESRRRSVPSRLITLSGERDRNEATDRRCFFGGRNEGVYLVHHLKVLSVTLI